MVNPWNLKEIRKSIKIALTMTEAQRISDHSHLLSYVKKFTSVHWGQTFVTDLTTTCNSDENCAKLPILNFHNIYEDIKNSKLVMNYLH